LLDEHAEKQVATTNSVRAPANGLMRLIPGLTEPKLLQVSDLQSDLSEEASGQTVCRGLLFEFLVLDYSKRRVSLCTKSH